LGNNGGTPTQPPIRNEEDPPQGNNGGTPSGNGGTPKQPPTENEENPPQGNNGTPSNSTAGNGQNGGNVAGLSANGHGQATAAGDQNSTEKKKPAKSASVKHRQLIVHLTVIHAGARILADVIKRRDQESINADAKIDDVSKEDDDGLAQMIALILNDMVNDRPSGRHGPTSWEAKGPLEIPMRKLYD